MKRRTQRTRKIAFTLLCLAVLAPSTAWCEVATESTHGGVEVVRVGDTIMYKYQDETGQVIYQDRPPPQYFEGTEAVEEVIEPVEERAVPVAPLDETTPTYVLGVLWLSVVAFAAGGAFVLLMPYLERWRTETPLDRRLRQAGLPTFIEVEASSGVRHRASVDRVVRTPAGLLVLAVQHLAGTVNGTADQEEWQQVTSAGTVTVINPLKRVRQAEQVVQEVAGDVPVHGRVVYSGNAKFSSAMPAQVQKLAVFKDGLACFLSGEVDQRSLDGAWRTLMRFPRRNKLHVEVMGVGWRGWLRRHWRVSLGAALLFLATILAIVALLLQV